MKKNLGMCLHSPVQRNKGCFTVNNQCCCDKPKGSDCGTGINGALGQAKSACETRLVDLGEFIQYSRYRILRNNE